VELVDCTEVIAILQGNYPNANFTDRSPEAWYATLREYDRSEVLAILPDAMKDSPDYCPSAPKIAKAIDDARIPPLNAQGAWEQVMRAIKACGCQNGTCLRREIEDDRVFSAASTIGWQRIGLAPFSDHGTLFAQFKGVLNDSITTARLEEQKYAIHLFGEGFPIGPGGFDTGDLPPEDGDA
jgi:hypothetical protein